MQKMRRHGQKSNVCQSPSLIKAAYVLPVLQTTKNLPFAGGFCFSVNRHRTLNFFKNQCTVCAAEAE